MKRRPALVFFGVLVAVGLSFTVGAAAEAPAALYAQSCASCHGTIGQGSSLAPPLIGVSADYIHFMLDTGRMPAEVSYMEETHKPSIFSKKQIDSLTNYIVAMTSEKDRSLPKVGPGDIRRGRALYAENCQQCHGAGGFGGAVGGGYERVAPPLSQASALQVAEALRAGPGTMPRFGNDVLSDQDVSDIAHYVSYLQTSAAPGGLQLSNVGPVAEGFVAWVLGLALIVGLARVLGTTT